jgi:SAM-dependent methyltransferase
MDCPPRQTPEAGTDLEGLAARWRTPGLGQRYRAQGAAGRRAHKDGEQCRRILTPLGGTGWLLDAPAGSGRLWNQLGTRPLRYVGLDISTDMLRAHPCPGRIVRARVDALPLADRSIDWVVCCRLLHHLSSAREWLLTLRELGRVARRGLLFSYFDASSWPAWRARLRGQRQDRAGRRYRSRAEITAWCLEAGLTAPRFEAQSGWFSAQAFALCQPAQDLARIAPGAPTGDPAP